MKRLGMLTVLVALAACVQATQENPAANPPTAQIPPTQTPLPQTPPARNVILFVGDGMGVTTLTAARIFEGQRRGEPGEENRLSFETFPHLALVKTYNTDMQVADSAGTATALLAGVKTRAGVLNTPPDVSRGDCAGALESPLPTLLEQSEARGLATGIVSTARITHATPAAAYAVSPDRNWESDRALPPLAVEAGCRDIAVQMLEANGGDGMEIMLGGGRAAFLPGSATDPESGQPGARSDGRHLIDAWLKGGAARSYLWNAKQLADHKSQDGEQVLGLFEYSHMQWEADRANDAAGEPSLAELTAFAIRRLARDDDGFFLLVEAGRIDHGHHFGSAYRALADTVALSDAVRVAMEATGDDTLIIVTADHSHTLTFAGYPRRGNPILGKVAGPDGRYLTDANGRPYTTLGYANGPGYDPDDSDLTDVDTTDLNYRPKAAIPMAIETHAGEDVPAYARGPGASGVAGLMDQEALYGVMRRALLGD